MLFLSLSVSRSSLSNQLRSRTEELDVKLLLYAIQKTTSFEKTLALRFAQSAYLEEVSSAFCCLCRVGVRSDGLLVCRLVSGDDIQVLGALGSN